MATTSLANRSASVSSEPDATSDGYVGASLCWRYARISLVALAARRTGEIKNNNEARGWYVARRGTNPHFIRC